MLLGATILALILKNSSYGNSYMEFLSVEIGLKIGNWELFKPSLLWISDGLIAIFFFAIGLELKKEFTQGEFKTLSNIILPLISWYSDSYFNDTYTLKNELTY
ncbi:Na+/H+ antiporter NhaA [Campylobacter volucris]|uniref:Na+/H+ antiporter NhaA n=1 Tax=Campylobacter volucris TaxID=1031542 RepID=UPI0016501AB2